MYSYGVYSSYTEYRRFKKSAAKATVADLKLSGTGVVDNVDTDISSLNGRQSTHSLDILLTQYSQNLTEGEEEAKLKKPTKIPCHQGFPDLVTFQPSDCS